MRILNYGNDYKLRDNLANPVKGGVKSAEKHTPKLIEKKEAKPVQNQPKKEGKAEKAEADKKA